VTILLPLLAFLFIALIVSAVAMVLAPAGGGMVEQRLGEIRGARVMLGGGGVEAAEERRDLVMKTIKRLGRAIPAPQREVGKLQQRLIWAGYRGKEAIIVFSGIRIGVSLVAFAILGSPLLFRPNILMALGAAALGYVVPGMLLARAAGRRQHRIRLSLPDALDLLVVSVEAGLGLDQAVQRVGDELMTAHPELSEEMRLINLEMRAGKERSEALRNLADRTGVDDVVSLVATLVQTDKFGTSVAQSLRIHSEVLRTKRRQRAEEAAAKTGVKMVFPLVLCVFPAVWIVTIGPAAIKFVQVLFPMANK
jgi:tight adherence protein C